MASGVSVGVWYESDAIHGVPTAFVGANYCVPDGRDVSMEHPLVCVGEDAPW